MKPKNLFAIAEKYIQISKVIAASKNQNYIPVLIKMVLCRLFYKHGPAEYCLYRLYDKTRAEWSEYLTSRETVQLQTRILSSQHVELVINKIFFYERCTLKNVPTPEILAVFSPKKIYIPEGIPWLKDKQSLHSTILKYDNQTLTFKIIEGSHGQDIFAITPKNGTIFDLDGKEKPVTEIFKYCTDLKKGFIIQKLLKPNQNLSPLMPGPYIGVFRLVTLFQDEGNINLKIPYASCGLPVGENIISNFWDGKTGNMVCCIDPDNGRIINAIRRLEGDLFISKVRNHPTSNISLIGWTIPYWDEVRRCVLKAAYVFPELRTIGWDVAITNQGITILEANCHWEAHQAEWDRGMKSELKKLFKIA